MRHEIRMRAHYLCSYIKDKTTVLAHINRDYGTRYTMTDLAEALATFSKPRKNSIATKKPLPLTAAIRTHKGKGYDPLAIALFKYHAARTEGEDKKYWLKKLGWVF